MSKIVVIGSSNIDMVVNVDHIPMPGETILSSNFFMNCGGKGANQAVAVARLGGEITFVSKLGDDSFGKKIKQNLENEGINIKYVATHKSEPTGIAFINIGNNADNSIVVYSGANNTLEEKDIDRSIKNIKEGAIILLQLEVPINTVLYSAKLAKMFNKKVILNQAPAQIIPKELYKLLYIITPNESEAEILTGIKVFDKSSAKKAAQELRKRGAPNVIITMGKQGAYLLTETLDKIIPVTDEVNAIDTTAAGDTFNGALAVAIAQGVKIEEAVNFANKAASITVTKLGAQSAIPYLKDVQPSKNDFVKP